MDNSKEHLPVMVGEVLEYLHIQKGKKYIDATLGLGGHTKEIVCRGGEVLGIEADIESLKIAKNEVEKFIEACPAEYQTVPGQYKLIHGNFRDVDKIAIESGFSSVDGILADLGVSTLQLTSDTRGFSFQNSEALLDMRLSPGETNIKASDLLNILGKDKLLELFVRVLSYPEAKTITNKVILARKEKAFETVGDLLSILPKKGFRGINPATLSFMALRIAVNNELENLAEFLPKAFGLLKKGGVMVIISFHSLEDKIVKTFIREMKEEGLNLTKKPSTPSYLELRRNPRSRSAKIRAIQKLL